MKYITLLLTFLIPVLCGAQSLTVDELKNASVTWYGLDFTHAKFVGESLDYNSVSAQEIKDKYFRAWNKLLIDEADKFDIHQYIGNKGNRKNIKKTMDFNKAVDASLLFTNNANYSIDKETLTQIAAKYANPSKKGLGALFVVEKFNKSEKSGTFAVLFFDVATGKIRAGHRLSGDAAGFSFRNYWAGSVYSVLKELKKKKKKLFGK